MNFQKEPTEEVIDTLKRTGVTYEWLDYYAFPETFASTSGPHGGIGGSAMSTFTVEAYVCNSIGPTVYTCAGKIKLKKGGYKASWY